MAKGASMETHLTIPMAFIFKYYSSHSTFRFLNKIKNDNFIRLLVLVATVGTVYLNPW